MDAINGYVEMGGASRFLDAALVNSLNENKDMEALKRAGGVEGLAKALGSDVHQGLNPEGSAPAGSPSDVGLHRQMYGVNKFTEVPPKSLWSIIYDNLQDPIIITLILAALGSTILGVVIPEQRAQKAWTEGVAIWVSMLIVVLVGSGNDYQKDQQFRKINAQRDVIMVKVTRGGRQQLVDCREVVVGDVLFLDTGDKVSADGVLVDTQGLVIDESSLTGESDPIKKSREEDPWCRSGTTVSEGCGHILVTAVGVHSEWGKTMALMQDAGDDETPLQVKLGDMAGLIGKAGVSVAGACFVALMLKWTVERGWADDPPRITTNGPVAFFLYAVTIVVVAVPEGLPLAVTISLAYSMTKMMKDNNFVRVLAACETMGGATAICSDKTGTLTENRMTVVEGWLAGRAYDHAPGWEETGDFALRQHLVINMAMNGKAFLEDRANGQVGLVGNRTDCAMLLLLRKWGLDYASIRKENGHLMVRLYAFSSARKMASVLLRNPAAGPAGPLRLYNKGAAEWVLKRCTSRLDADGAVRPMSPQDQDSLTEVVTAMAKRGLRCIALAYADVDPSKPAEWYEDSENVDQNLTAYAVIGIKDPVRAEVPEAVRVCQNAGIVVRMVTGDNIHTAQHIARECGILKDEDTQLAMEGPAFRVMTPEQLAPLLPRLAVLARSSPEDKLTLVRALKQLGDVVAVTGDGTNDAPALAESDVGLAMGIAGTEVAKEAADIVILDDNFSSIVKSVLWGRCVFNNIRKFLQFQLTVNFGALVVAFVGAVAGGHEPLNVLQLLWVNLIMDSIGALALATEEPHPALLAQKPYARTERLLTPTMIKHILVQGGYQIFWMFFCMYGLPRIGPTRYSSTGLPSFDANKRALSVLFNLFIWCQIVNQINARRLKDEYDVFDGLLESRVFMSVLGVEALLQFFIMMTPVSALFKVTYLNLGEWVLCLAIGASTYLVSMATRYVSRTYFAAAGAQKYAALD